MTQTNFPACELYPDKNCQSYFSCKMLQERFGVNECMSKEERLNIINAAHEKELEVRKKLLESRG